MYPLKLKPIYDKTIWGNNKLTSARNDEGDQFGTSWEVSAHPYCSNVIENGEYAGKTLMELVNENENDMLGKHDKDHVLRAAHLDAKGSLSIQVHPYDEYAIKNENDMGKTEAWYVIHADEGAKLCAGCNCSDEATVRAAIADGTLEQHLRYVPMEAGDFIYINAGQLHALGAGIWAIEVGTNSNITYRFYDYNRKDANGNGRPLHIEKSFDVVDLGLKTEKVVSPVKEKITENEMKYLCDTEAFTIELHDIADEVTFDTDGKFHLVNVVDKNAEIVYNNIVVPVEFTRSVFIPASCGKYTIKGEARVLVSYIK